MIQLTRLDGEPFVLNAELIRYVERRPDTFVTLTSGDPHRRRRVDGRGHATRGRIPARETPVSAATARSA